MERDFRFSIKVPGRDEIVNQTYNGFILQPPPPPPTACHVHFLDSEYLEIRKIMWVGFAKNRGPVITDTLHIYMIIKAIETFNLMDYEEYIEKWDSGDCVNCWTRGMLGTLWAEFRDNFFEFLKSELEKDE